MYQLSRFPGPTSFTKTKKVCQSSEDTPHLIHPDELFSVTMTSNREASYEMSHDLSSISVLRTKESHEVIVNIRQEAGNKVETVQEMVLKKTGTITPLIGDDLGEIVEKISEESGWMFSHETLMTEVERKMCQDAECPSFAKLVKENIENLHSENFGKIKGASGFLRILNAARDAKKDEILKVLKGKSFKKIL